MYQDWTRVNKYEIQKFMFWTPALYAVCMWSRFSFPDTISRDSWYWGFKEAPTCLQWYDYLWVHPAWNNNTLSKSLGLWVILLNLSETLLPNAMIVAREGKVFASVCHSVHKRGVDVTFCLWSHGLSWAVWCAPSQGVWLRPPRSRQK